MAKERRPIFDSALIDRLNDPIVYGDLYDNGKRVVIPSILPKRPEWMIEPGAKRRPNDWPESEKHKGKKIH